MAKAMCLYCNQIEIEPRVGHLPVCKDCEEAYFENCKDCLKGDCNMYGYGHHSLASGARRVGRVGQSTHTARLVS